MTNLIKRIEEWHTQNPIWGAVVIVGLIAVAAQIGVYAATGRSLDSYSYAPKEASVDNYGKPTKPRIVRSNNHQSLVVNIANPCTAHEVYFESLGMFGWQLTHRGEAYGDPSHFVAPVVMATAEKWTPRGGRTSMAQIAHKMGVCK